MPCRNKSNRCTAWLVLHDFKLMGQPTINKLLKLSATTGIDFKEKDGEFFAEGFVATTHPDRVNDVIPKSTIQKIVEKINNNRANSEAGAVSWHHDRTDKDLVARAVQAEVRPLKDGHAGAFVKVQLNKEHPDFAKHKYEIENKFVGGFSIEYVTNNSHPTIINGEEHRVLDEIDLRGFGFAGPRSIANPEAALTGFGEKEKTQAESLAYKELISMHEREAIQMTEQQKMEKKEVPAAPEQKEVSVPEKKVEVSDAEFKEYLKFQEMKKQAAREAELKEAVKKELSSIIPEIKAKFNEGNKPVENKELLECKEFVAWKEMMKPDAKISAKEAFDRARDLAEKKGMMTKEAFLRNKGSHVSPFSAGRMDFKSRGMLGERIELKALETDTNQSSDTDYLQSAAELSDIYQPAITMMLNQRTTLWGLLPKDNFSNAQEIQWRAENVANASAGAYFEGAAVTKGNTTRQKLNEHFKYYSVGVQVTGQMIASARGGVGGIFNIEIEAATRALLSVLNTGLYAEKGAFTDEEFLGMEYIADSAGNTTLYGLTRSATNLLGASGSEYAAQAGATIARDTLRTAIRTQVVNGCDRSKLFFVTHPLQIQLIMRECMDEWQRLDRTARAGFEGSLSFDGIPIFEDKDCNSDDIYLVDPEYLHIGVQVPVTYEDLAQSDDSKSGYLKFYGNVYATAPKKAVYMIQGLATS